MAVEDSTLRCLLDLFQDSKRNGDSARLFLETRNGEVFVNFSSQLPVGVPSGFEEVRINTPKEVENVDPKTQAIRIARTVGDKKREVIVEKADELGIRVFNRRDL